MFNAWCLARISKWGGIYAPRVAYPTCISMQNDENGNIYTYIYLYISHILGSRTFPLTAAAVQSNVQIND